MVKAVSYGAGREPIVIGKPHPPIMNVIEERYVYVCFSAAAVSNSLCSTQLDRTRTLMVGDR